MYDAYEAMKKHLGENYEEWKYRLVLECVFFQSWRSIKNGFIKMAPELEGRKKLE